MSKSQRVRGYLDANPTASVRQITEDLKEYGISEALAGKVKYSERREGPSPERTVRKPLRRHPRMSRRSTAVVGKADVIREVVTAMGRHVRPRDLRAKLAERGIVVSNGRISQVLKSMGLHRRRHKSARAPSTVAGTTRTSGVSVDDLVAAKSLADQLGGIEKARAVLAGLARLM
jgi:hypothetical protein